jgi:hypothetical protein
VDCGCLIALISIVAIIDASIANREKPKDHECAAAPRKAACALFIAGATL